MSKKFERMHYPNEYESYFPFFKCWILSNLKNNNSSFLLDLFVISELQKQIFGTTVDGNTMYFQWQ